MCGVAQTTDLLQTPERVLGLFRGGEVEIRSGPWLGNSTVRQH